jgi:hypothetical protein
MAHWAADHLTKLTDNVKRDDNHLRQQVHSDCTSTIGDLTAANRSSIDALQVNFLREMTDQITKALINEKREFHALVMDTLTKSNHHLKRLSSCLRRLLLSCGGGKLANQPPSSRTTSSIPPQLQALQPPQPIPIQSLLHHCFNNCW